VGVMTDPTDVSTLQVVNNNIAINPGSSTAWAEFVVNLDTFTGNGAYIAIGAVRPSSAWYMYMDDISVVQIPDCEGVSNFTATNITTSQADLNWTENGNATSWTIEYGPHGFVPGSSAALTETVSTLPHTIYGLNANTEYDVYVTPSCTGMTETFMFTFRTECPAMATLPYSYGFEGLATGSNTVRPVINCWHHLNNSSSYPGWPYVSSTSHNGSRSLYWYNTTTSGYSDYQTVVLPAVDTDLYPINTLQLKFWAKSSSTSYYPIFQVGVMSDPNDVTTFQRIQTINVGNNTNWAEFVVGLASFTGNGQYIALHAPRTSSTWYAYTDDFTLEEAPQCPPITHLTVEDVSNTGAFITWNYQEGLIGTPQEYEIEYYEVGSTASPTYLTDTLPQVFINGLDSNTTYRVRVRANCFEYDYGAWDSVTFTTTSRFGCLEIDTNSSFIITLNSGTAGTCNYLPVGNYYNYSYTQELVLASELQGAGSITGIDFEYSYATASTDKTNCTIYLVNTTETSLASAFVPYSNDFQMVYTGPLNCTQGWNHFEFTTPFAYDGSSNLLIVVHDNSGDYNGSAYTFANHSTAAGRSRYVQNDSSPYTISSVTGGTSQSVTTNMKLNFTGCSQYSTCAAPLVRVNRVGSRDAEIVWAAGMSETAWDVEYRMTSSPSWTTAVTGTTSMNYTLLNLQPATEYKVRVSHYCAADDTTYATILDITTDCEPYHVPFFENFDSYVASSATQLGRCWNKYYNSTILNTASYPYPSASYHHSGTNSLYFYGYNDTYCNWLVLPQMADSIRTLELSFWEYKTSASYGLVEIGVITDPEDLTTFVPVDTVQVDATSQWQQFYVNFLNYEGPEGRIAMVGRTSNSYSFYIDDIEVNRYSSCPRVQALSAYRVTNDSAYISWTGDSTVSGFRAWWGSSDVLANATDSADLTNASLILGGLGPNQTRYVWVSQFCGDGEMSSPVRTSFTTAADCEVVTELYIHNVTSNSALFTWNAPQEGYPAVRYIVSWQSPSSTVYADTAVNPFYFLSGLDSITTYNFSVVAICEHDNIYDTSYAVSRTFTTHDSQCNRIVGVGTNTTTSSAPLYTSRDYEYTHMLFFADELAQMGDTIRSLTFNVTTSGSITRNVDVYLGNSDYENLYTPVFPPLSTLTQVYSGNWTVQNGQCTLTFDTIFVRDHSRNLVVGFDDNTGDAGTSFSFSAAYTSDINTGDYIYTVHYAGGAADVNPAIDEAVNVTYTRPIITFGTTCADASCSSPAAVAANATDTTITLYWNASSGTAWQVEYRLPTDSVWTVAATNVTTNSYVLGGLRVATRYAIRVGSICSANNILFTPIFGETACGDALLPYTDDFNDIVNGWYERTCWRVGNVTGAANNGNTSTPNYPRVVNLTQRGPHLRLYNGAYAVMPHFAEPLNSLQVRFEYFTSFTTDAWCLFGYLTNPDDINTLVVIDTLRHHPAIEGERLYTIDLDFLPSDADG
ncbi:MAG: fibronectin type III domain-containing protein, partial [Bacteroidales bacterium]|nr:fibronectin type III domain-containing protein [Bacteroidales bacterium]